MNLELRKFAKFVDKTLIEGGKEAKEPVLLVSVAAVFKNPWHGHCLLYTSPSPRDRTRSRMPSSA